MSKHTWVLQNIESYLAGGLDTSERERIERHTTGCAECRRVLDATREVDDKLGALFAGVHPDARLEERMIQSLQTTPARRRPSLVIFLWSAAAAAAVVLLTVFGAGLTAWLEDGETGFGVITQNNLRQIGIGLFDDSGSMRRYTDFTHGTTHHGLNYRPSKTRKPNHWPVPATQHGTTFYHIPPVNHPAKGTSNGTMGEYYDPVNISASDGTSNTTNLREFVKNIDTLSSGLRGRAAVVMTDGDDGVAFSPDGKSLASGGQTNGVRLWDTTSGKQMQSRNELKKLLPNGFLSGLTPGGTFTPDSNPPKKQPKLVDNETGERTTRTDGEKRPTDAPPSNKSNDKRVSLSNADDYYNPADAFAKLTNQATEVVKSKKKVRDVVGYDATAHNKMGDPNDAGGDKKNFPAGDPKKGNPGGQGQKPDPKSGRKIIRSGTIQFEVVSFDDSVKSINDLIEPLKKKGAFVATTNSDRLPNGKMRGSVVVRMPPNLLDDFIKSLRKVLTKTGDLISLSIGSQDITKQYTDLESKLRAAKTMEERLLKIIKDGKGEVKDLIVAEKELGRNRQTIEQVEGEIRYYNNQVSLSTLTISLTEKSITSAVRILENEQVRAGIEVEDVEKAMRDALKAVKDNDGRITKSELKQHSAGQFNALLHFEVKPDKAGLVRDRLKQIGTMVRLEINRLQQTEGGGPAPKDGKIKRGDTQFFISIYNLANVAPRETITMKVASKDVADFYQKLRNAVADAKGRVRNAQLNENDRQNVNAQLDFDVRRADDDKITTALKEAGAVLSRQAARVAQGDNVTDAKVLYKVEFVSAAAIPPRKVVTLGILVEKVDATVTVFSSLVEKAGGRVISSAKGRKRDGTIIANYVYDVPYSELDSLLPQFENTGNVRFRDEANSATAPSGKLAVARIEVTVQDTGRLVPQEESLLSQIRHGLSVSLRGLTRSVSYLIVAVLVILPWLLVIVAVIWLVRRIWRGGRRPVAAGANGGGKKS